MDVEAILKELRDRFVRQYAPVIAVGDGWMLIIADLHRQLLDIDPDYQIYQIKEKFGGLRYYTTIDSDPKAREAILSAEHRSFLTCERCGKPGELRTDRSWLKTLCDDCHKEK